LFDELPLGAETAPTKPTSRDSSLVPSGCDEEPCSDGHQLPSTAEHRPESTVPSLAAMRPSRQHPL